jgi:hypothetical protein
MGSFFSPAVMRRITIGLWVLACVLVIAIAWRLLFGR